MTEQDYEDSEAVNAESNDRAVLISETIEFLEELMSAHRWPPDVMAKLIDWRDKLRAGMSMDPPGPADGEAEEGMVA